MTHAIAQTAIGLGTYRSDPILGVPPIVAQREPSSMGPWYTRRLTWSKCGHSSVKMSGIGFAHRIVSWQHWLSRKVSTGGGMPFASA